MLQQRQHPAATPLADHELVDPLRSQSLLAYIRAQLGQAHAAFGPPGPTPLGLHELHEEGVPPPINKTLKKRFGVSYRRYRMLDVCTVFRVMPPSWVFRRCQSSNYYLDRSYKSKQ